MPDSPAEPCSTEETNHVSCIEIPIDLESIKEADTAWGSKYNIDQFVIQPNPRMEATKKPSCVNLDMSDYKNKKSLKDMNENCNENKTSTNLRQINKMKLQTKSQLNSK